MLRFVSKKQTITELLYYAVSLIGQISLSKQSFSGFCRGLLQVVPLFIGKPVFRYDKVSMTLRTPQDRRLVQFVAHIAILIFIVIVVRVTFQSVLCFEFIE